MSLLNRLQGSEQPRINAHGLQAAMSEWSDGAVGFSRATIVTAFGLTVDDETELDQIKAIWDTANTSAKRLRMQKTFDNIVLLASDRDNTFYKVKSDIITRLTEAAS